jgi:hypothetical protein
MFLHPSQIQQFHIQNPKILKNTTNSIKISTLSKVSRHYKKKKKKEEEKTSQLQREYFVFVCARAWRWREEIMERKLIFYVY